MPPERESVTRKIRLGNLEGYVTIGLYPEGKPGEMFLTFDQVGSMERGLCNALALMTSLALQRGVPLEDIVAKLRGQKFEPAGMTGDKEIPMADIIVDFIARWISLRFLKEPK